MEWAELYGYDNEDDPVDPERLTVIDDPFTMIATGWDDGQGYPDTGMDEEF